MFAFAARSGDLQFFLLRAIALCFLMWPIASWAYSGEEQQACTPDAFRLCGDAIPDVDRVTACMIRKKSELSPGCRVYFRSPEPVAAPAAIARRPVRPVRITPVTARKPVSVKPRPVSVKPKKPKKSARPASAT